MLKTGPKIPGYVFAELQKQGVETSMNNVSVHLSQLVNEGYAERDRSDGNYSITERGKRNEESLNFRTSRHRTARTATASTPPRSTSPSTSPVNPTPPSLPVQGPGAAPIPSPPASNSTRPPATAPASSASTATSSRFPRSGIIPAGTAAEIGWGLKTTAPDGSARVTYPGYTASAYDNSFAWQQGAITAIQPAARLADFKVSGSGLLGADNIMLVQSFVALNTTGLTIHMEPTLTVVYRFERMEVISK